MATLLDGKALAEKIVAGLKGEFSRLTERLTLAAVVVGENPVIATFIAQKQKIAEELGVDFRIYQYPAAISTNDLRKRLATVVHEVDPDGIIIQLPLPPRINTQYILNSVPPEKDVDVLSASAVGDFAVGKARVLPPVVGAMEALFEEYGIDYRTKHVVVVGAGRLVGKPVALWLANQKVSFTVVDENTTDIAMFTKQADMIISGVGKPGLITGDMVQAGAVVIDAGTSESAGKIVGDVDFGSACKRAAYLTPVPGGLGPLTVAMIFRNLTALAA